MIDDLTRGWVRSAVALSALVMFVLGVALLFAPEEVGRALLHRESGGPLVQLLGAALLGAAAMSWTARGSVLGGIYGRAVVAGNQAHLTVGALLLLRHGFAAGGSAAFWALAGAYALGAGLFTYLLFFSPGTTARPPRG